MSFQDDIATLNQFYFFREFTFSKNTFRPTVGAELELADNVVWLDDILIVYQLKERAAASASTPDDERRWFERKALGKATRQIRDTLRYLGSHPLIEVQNHRGQPFNLANAPTSSAQKLILYLPGDGLPKPCKEVKHHESHTVGLIHVMPADDYLGVLRALATPAEVAEYLRYREAVLRKF